MELELNQEQQMLQRSAREFLEQECPFSLVRDMERSHLGYSMELWKKVADLGWLGLVLPEKYGGMERDNVTLAVLCQEMGRFLFPSPFINSIVMCGTILAEAAPEKLKQDILTRLIAGDPVVTLAITEGQGVPHPKAWRSSARLQAGDYIINAHKMFVENALQMEYFLVPVLSVYKGVPEQSVSLFLVPAKSPGIEIAPLVTMAEDRQYQVIFHDVTVPKTHLLGEFHHGWPILERALWRGVVAQSAYMVGGGYRAHELGCEFAKTRIQFGRPIASFQGVSHPLAQVATELAAAETLTYYTAWAMDNGRPAREAIATTKVFASDAAKYSSQVACETYGGIGFAQEVDVNLFLTRMKQLQLTLGDTYFWEEILAEELIDKKEIGVPWRLDTSKMIPVAKVR